MSTGAERARKIAVALVATVDDRVRASGVRRADARRAPTPTRWPRCPPNATWLQTLNAWRTASHVDPVTENPTWSAGDAAHSKYIVETGDFGHDEDSGGPFATADGLAAGNAGNVAASSDATKSDRGFVEQWITAPFHAAGMLDSQLATTGFGSYRRAGATPWPAAATLDVIRGRTPGFPLLATTFPGYNTVVPVAQQSYRGGESPDPLAPCSGYEDGGDQHRRAAVRAPAVGADRGSAPGRREPHPRRRHPGHLVRVRRDELHERGLRPRRRSAARCSRAGTR